MSVTPTKRPATIALAATAALAAAVFIPAVSSASSHREAPAISEDPVADLTDVYAFVSPDNAAATTLVMHVNPFETPAGGPNFHRFGDDVLYEFNIDVNGDGYRDISNRWKLGPPAGSSNGIQLPMTVAVSGLSGLLKK